MLTGTMWRSAQRLRFPALHATAHQGLEYLVAAVLAYTATHYPSGSAPALLAVAVVVAVVAAISPGHLAVRPLFGHRARRAADAVIAAAASAVVITLTTTDLLPSVVLAGSAAILARLALSSIPSTASRTATARAASTSMTRRQHLGRDLQPALNRGARAAGVLVRTWRSNKTRS